MLLFRRLDLYLQRKYILQALFVSLVLLGIGGFLAANTPKYTTTDITKTVAVEGSFSHYADAQRDSQLFEKGERVENRQEYLRNVHSQLVVSHSVSGSNSSADISSEVVVYSDQGQTELGSISLPEEQSSDSKIVTESSDSIQIDTTELILLAEDLQKEVPRGSLIRLEVTATTYISAYDEKITDRLYVTLDREEIYQVTTETEQYTYEETTQRTQVQESQTITLFGDEYRTVGLVGIFLGFLSLGVTNYLVYGLYFSEKTLDVSKFKYQFEKYQDWITTGRPAQDPSLKDRSNLVMINELKGLVDVAVQNDSRIVYTKSLNQFFVYDGDTTYVYQHPEIQGKQVLWSSDLSQSVAESANQESIRDDFDQAFDSLDDIENPPDFDNSEE